MIVEFIAKDMKKISFLVDKIIGFAKSEKDPNQTALWVVNDSQEFILNEKYEDVATKINQFRQPTDTLDRILSKLEVLIDNEIYKEAKRIKSVQQDASVERREVTTKKVNEAKGINNKQGGKGAAN